MKIVRVTTDINEYYPVLELKFKKKFRLYFSVLILFMIASQTIYSMTKGVDLIQAQTNQGQPLKLYKSSHALLIGISNYTAGWSDLTAIPEELSAVESVLKLHQFKVKSISDPSSKELEKSIKDFIIEHGYDSDSRLLIYFSGHGYSRGQKGYLVPSDAPSPLDNEIGFLKKALPMSQILAWSRQMEAKHVLFLFDSCFSGTVFQARNLPQKPPHITRLTNKKVRQFITAGSAGEEVPAASTFTPAFVDGIGAVFIADMNHDGYVTGTELGLYLQGEVPKYVNQLPQFGKIRDYNLSRGDFVFVSPKKVPIVTNKPKIVIKKSNEKRTEESLSHHDSQLKLTTCVLHFKANRLTKGRGGNALECYEQALAIDPDNSKALAGIKQIENKYASWTEVQMAKGNLNKAEEYLKKIAMINPESEQLAQLQEALDELQQKLLTAEGQASFGKQEVQERKQPYDKMTELVAGIKFVNVPSGCFQMGSDTDYYWKHHRVCITKDYYLSQYEITQGQWYAIMGNNPSYYKTGDDHPVESVSWDDVQIFIRKLNAKTGKHFRLPTEAEWEYACRSGGKNQTFCGSNIGDKVAWYGEDLAPGHHVVGGKSPNGLGLYDMSGNVWEWTQDWFGNRYYENSPVNDPTGPSAPNPGLGRVVRGGSWNALAEVSSSTYRSSFSRSDIGTYTHGFRLARTH